MEGNNVAGTLPGDVGFLTDLTTIILSRQKIVGSIPDSYSSLSKLELVLLLENQLTGTFPEVLIGPSIKYLDMGRNQFNGQLPSSISSTALTDLRFDSCQLTGAIPPEIANLSNLGECFFGVVYMVVAVHLLSDSMVCSCSDSRASRQRADGDHTR